ncbi:MULTISPECIES: hypothetical protein [unclassified Streptomyces]|uniref:hypothetical protein n=1 Tax=unclassified Streptomyces TaxID=2593676 RepID=UPI002E1E460D|nr:MULTISPECIES: hypothetical protein [unclassified Streptomyces]
MSMPSAVRSPAALPATLHHPHPGGSRLEGRRVPLLAVLAVVPLYALWAAFYATGGGDLAAQDAWAGFFARNPGTPYGLFWFGGVHVANYSVLSPPLMAVLGGRTVAVLAGVSATWLLGKILQRTLTRAPLWPALLGSLGLWVNVALGRTTFALGLAFGLAGLLALAGRRPRPARLAAGALGTLLATLSSPVAGLFALVAGAGYLLDRQYGKCLALALPPVAAVATTTLLFPFHGEQPMSAARMSLPVLISTAVVWVCPRAWRAVRAGAVLYGAGVVLCWLIPSPIGSNVERLGVHLAPAVLLAGLLHTRAAPRLRTQVTALILTVSVVHLARTPADCLRGPDPVPAWAMHTSGLLQELDRLGADRGRLEVPAADDHREAALFAPDVQLMRGFNQQLDKVRGRMFYEGRPDARRYHAWLRHWAVGYVAVHDGPPDRTAVREAELIKQGQDWLEPVWHDRYWTLYRVRDTLPLASAPAEVLAAGEADVTVRMPHAGTAVVRVVHSPWLQAEGACVSADGPWTRLTVPKAGVYRLTSSYLRSPPAPPDC